MAWDWDESPNIDSSKDIEFFADSGSGNLTVPFAVVEVYAEACGGGGGGGTANKDDKDDPSPDNAASGGGGGAWCYKTFQVVEGSSFDWEVGEGGSGPSGNGNTRPGEKGGDSEIELILPTDAPIVKPDPMRAEGGPGGENSETGDAAQFVNADGGDQGGKGQGAESDHNDAYGGKGGGAAGKGSGSHEFGDVTVRYTVTTTYKPDWGQTPTTETFFRDFEVEISGGPGGDGIEVGGGKREDGPDAEKKSDGYYLVNGYDGAKYGGGGGGGSAGHEHTGPFYNTDGYNDPGQLGDLPLIWLYGFDFENTERRGDGGDGADGFVYFSADYRRPVIDSFSIKTNENLGASPDSFLEMSWQTRYASEIYIEDSDGNIYYSNVSEDSDGRPAKSPDRNDEQVETDITGTATGGNLKMQSNVENGPSPAKRTFTLRAVGPGGQRTKQAVGRIYNDDCITVPTVADIGPIPPSTDFNVSFIIQGIDMPTIIQSGTGVTFEIDASGDSLSNGVVTNGQSVTAKGQSLPYCKDERGIENHKVMYLEIGSGNGDCNVKRVEFTVKTEAPKVDENFDFVDNDKNIPFPKIDTTEEIPQPYMINNNGPQESTFNQLNDPYGVTARSRDFSISPPYAPKEFFQSLYGGSLGPPTTDAEIRVNRVGAGLQDWKEPYVIGTPGYEDISTELPPADGPNVVGPDEEYTDPTPPVPTDLPNT